MPPSKADGVGRLSIGAAPRAGESLPGFVVRLAARTRIATPERLAAMAGLRQPGSAVTGVDLTCLAEMAGVDRAALETLTYRPAVRPAHQVFMGAAVSREFIRLDSRRFCPACLGEQSHHRACWDLALVTACPVHRIRLIERCPHCRRRFGWNGSLTHCRCGIALAEIAASPVTLREASVAGRTLGLLAPDRPAWLPSPLAACDPGDLLRLLMCLGAFTTGWTRQRRIESLISAGPDTVARVTCAGLAAFEDWPRSLHSFLARQKAGSGDRRGKFGARKSLGPFYEWLTLMEAGPVKSALAEASASWVSADPELSRMAHRSRLLTSGDAEPALALSDAAALLKTTGTRVKRMMAAGLIPEVASSGRGVPMLIGRSAVEHLAAVVPDALTLAQAAEVLGISKSKVRTLAEAGILQPVHEAAGEGWARWAFPRVDVMSLPDRLYGGEPTIFRGRLVGFDTAAEAFRRRGAGLGAMLSKVADGSLPVRSRDGSGVGLKQLRFSFAEVRAACRALEAGDHVTLQAAAERMGLKWQVVANLVARGLLPSRDGMLSMADVDVFRSSHVTGSQLARERRTSPRALEAQLRKQGIHPVVGPNEDGSRQNIYLRTPAC